jgi:branched-chain amino acid transport system permease protein
MPYWETIPIAALICFVAGFLFGLPALRLDGPYLALATFALAVATPQLLKYHGIEDWTGGVQGILIDKPEAPSFLGINSDQYLYLFCLGVTVLMFVLGANLLRGRTGRAILAIRDQPTAAASMGIDVSLYKSLTFGVSALLTGVAGSLGALIAQFVSPDSFTLFLSISFIVGVVVGGVATVSGAFFGALFIEFVPPLADQISKAAPWAVYGVLLIFCVYVMPGGVVGLLRWCSRALGREVPKPRQLGRARLIP